MMIVAKITTKVMFRTLVGAMGWETNAAKAMVSLKCALSTCKPVYIFQGALLLSLFSPSSFLLHVPYRL